VEFKLGLDLFYNLLCTLLIVSLSSSYFCDYALDKADHTISFSFPVIVSVSLLSYRMAWRNTI